MSASSEGTPLSRTDGAQAAAISAFPQMPLRGKSLVVMTDMEPDDIEAIMLLFCELERTEFPRDSEIIFITGGASAYVSSVRLRILLEELVKVFGFRYRVICGISDPLNLKEQYWTDLASDERVNQQDREVIASIGSSYGGLIKQRNQFEEELVKGVKDDICFVYTEKFEKYMQRLDAFLQDVGRTARLHLDEEAIRKLFTPSQNYCVVCLKKPDELIWLMKYGGGLRLGESILWLYAGKYNVEAAKHEVPERFRNDFTSVLSQFKVVVAMSLFVVVQRRSPRAKRDVSDLTQYKAMCAGSSSPLLRMLADRTLTWNAATYKKWTSRNGIARDLTDLVEVVKSQRTKEATAAIDANVADERDRGALLNMLKEPYVQRVLADQLAIILLFGRWGKTMESGSAKFEGGFLKVDGGTPGNAFEILNLSDNKNGAAKEIETNDEAFALIDEIMVGMAEKLESAAVGASGSPSSPGSSP